MGWLILFGYLAMGWPVAGWLARQAYAYYQQHCTTWLPPRPHTPRNHLRYAIWWGLLAWWVWPLVLAYALLTRGAIALGGSWIPDARREVTRR